MALYRASHLTTLSAGDLLFLSRSSSTRVALLHLAHNSPSSLRGIADSSAAYFDPVLLTYTSSRRPSRA